MPEEPPNISSPNSISHSSWDRIWVSAITRPSVVTFETLANDPQATSRRAYLWIVVSALIGYGISIIFPLIRGDSTQWVMVLAIPFLTLAALLFLIIITATTQFIARALGGTGTYAKLLFAYATFNAPMTIMTGILAVVPFWGLTFLLGAYWLVLHVIALKAVNKFSWSKAVIAILPLLVGIVLLSLGAISVLYFNLRQPAG